MASGAMADQVPNISISSAGAADNLASYSTNHLESDSIAPKIKARAPPEGTLTSAK